MPALFSVETPLQNDAGVADGPRPDLGPASLAEIAERSAPLAPYTSVGDVATLLRADAGVLALAVVERGRPVGLVNRHALLSVLSQRYGWSLFASKPIAVLMNPKPAIVEIDTPLEALGRLLTVERPEALLEGFVLVEGGRYVGIAAAPQVVRRFAADLQRRERSLVEAKELLEDHRARLEEMVEARTRIIEAQAAKLERALAHERALNEQQRQFVSTVSHEFRTPLAIIDGAAARLERRRGEVREGDLEKGLGRIRGAVERLTRLIESVLGAAHSIGGEAAAATLEPLDLVDLVREAADELRDAHPSAEIAFEQAGERAPIAGDRRLLLRAVSNLIGNAVKYSPPGARVEVLCRPKPEGGFEVSVTDRGVGIPEDELSRVFERFYRARTAIRHAGTGIGLALVKEAVDRHGGEITVASVVGEGSTFTIRLPARPPRPTPSA